MKKLRKAFTAALCAAALLPLCGCQPTPETEAVTSKNDGAFQAALQTTAEDSAADETEAETAGTYTASFTTTDGGTEYTVSLTVPAADTALPVVRVTPEAISSETAEKIARAVAGEAEWHEYSRQLTKTELETAILEVKQRLTELAATADEYTNDVEECEALLEQYESEYASAPDTLDTPVYDFSYHDFSYYDPYAGEGGSDSEWIWGKAETDVGVYIAQGCRLDTDDMKIFNLSVSLSDTDVTYWASADDVTDADLDAAVSRAQTLIEAMDLGTEWTLTAEASTNYTADGYFISVSAVPAYNGVAMTTHAYVYNESGEETLMDDSYAASYDSTLLYFNFAADGTLVYCYYDSPVAVVEETNENVQTLSFDEIMEKFQTNMSLRDSSYYTTHVIDNHFFFETGRAEVTVDRVVLGMGRVRVQDSATDYYIVPTYTFYGSVAMFDEEGNQLSYYDYNTESEVTGAMDAELVVLNAVDGSVVDIMNEY